MSNQNIIPMKNLHDAKSTDLSDLFNENLLTDFEMNYLKGGDGGDSSGGYGSGDDSPPDPWHP